MNFTKDKFMSFYKGTPNEQSASDCFDAVFKAVNDAGIYSDLTMIGICATIRTEVGKSFTPVRENISQTLANENYNGRMGNTLNSNDGYLYRGGGLIQLTGRDNYIHYGNAIGVDLVNNPDKILDINVSAKVLAQYFKERKCNVYCDAKAWVNVRLAVNGGDNGLDVFLSIVQQYLGAIITNVPNQIKTMDNTNTETTAAVEAVPQTLTINSITVNYTRTENGVVVQENNSVEVTKTPELLSALALPDAGLVIAGYDVTLV